MALPNSGHLPDNIYDVRLLFMERPDRPTNDAIRSALGSRFENLRVLMDSAFSAVFSISSADDIPQFGIGELAPFLPDTLPSLTCRGKANRESQVITLLKSGGYHLGLSCFFNPGLDYQTNCDQINQGVEAMVELMPDCAAALYVPSLQVVTATQLRKNPYQGALRFLYAGLSVRSFPSRNQEELVVDTLGLYALGLPDVQCRCSWMNEAAAKRLVFNVAAYQYETGVTIAGGDTISGILSGLSGQAASMHCERESSLFAPWREVIAVHLRDPRWRQDETPMCRTRRF